MTWPSPLLRIATAWRPYMNASISGASTPAIWSKSCLAFIRSAAPPASRPQPGYRRAISRNVRMMFGFSPSQIESQLIPLDGFAAVGGFGVWPAGDGPAVVGPAPGDGGAGAAAGAGWRATNIGGATSRATTWLPAERCSAETCGVPNPDGRPCPEPNARTAAAIGAENAPIGAAPAAAGAATTGWAASSCSSCGVGSGMEPEPRTYPAPAR